MNKNIFPTHRHSGLILFLIVCALSCNIAEKQTCVDYFVDRLDYSFKDFIPRYADLNREIIYKGIPELKTKINICETSTRLIVDIQKTDNNEEFCKLVVQKKDNKVIDFKINQVLYPNLFKYLQSKPYATLTSVFETKLANFSILIPGEKNYLNWQIIPENEKENLVSLDMADLKKTSLIEKILKKVQVAEKLSITQPLPGLDKNATQTLYLIKEYKLQKITKEQTVVLGKSMDFYNQLLKNNAIDSTDCHIISTLDVIGLYKKLFSSADMEQLESMNK